MNEKICQITTFNCPSRLLSIKSFLRQFLHGEWSIRSMRTILVTGKVRTFLSAKFSSYVSVTAYRLEILMDGIQLLCNAIARFKLPQIPKKTLVLISWILEGWKTKPTVELHGDTKLGIPGKVIQLIYSIESGDFPL